MHLETWNAGEADPDRAKRLAIGYAAGLLLFAGIAMALGFCMIIASFTVPMLIAGLAIIGTGMAKFWGWSLGAGLVLGLSLSVASTVVLLKALEERNAVATPNGRIAIGWLIVEDLVMVVTLVLLPALAEVFGGRSSAVTAGDSPD